MSAEPNTNAIDCCIAYLSVNGENDLTRAARAELHRLREAETLALDFACFVVGWCVCRGLGHWEAACPECGNSTWDHECYYPKKQCTQATCVAARELLANHSAAIRQRPDRGL